ncbi:MAG: LysR substrate-binding domain-containing protein [Pseudomonadota bacterium]|uniref:LysR family transcriptional regulator n=1 Tax=Ralstonia pickettii TaxID=329 RepID=UPI002714F481|nr:LysR substrate-binding domain-containing protein [Ralstonia pickettii]MEE2976066.1 LysR substrate-binding domain-containing protein [Pseudomonadota bacterium]WKZ85259.1 LysR substrate-binding domain-containing protein [Ralstonia pickettii]
MAKNLDITLVRTFIAVAENASMTVAANALHLTQGAISQQIKRLEDAFECRLFERDGRRLELTHAGERFLGRAKRLLALNDEIWADMAARPLQGPVRLGVPYDLVGTVFPPIFKAFTEAWPSVELTIVCGTSPELAEGMARGELDLAVVEAPVDEATGECLCVERLVWVGPRGGNVHAKRPLPLSMVDENCAFRARVLKALGEHGIEWRTVFESGNIEATTATVRTGLAVTAWLTPTVPADLDILGPEAGLPELPMFAISLLVPAQGASQATQALAQCIRDGFSTRQSALERKRAA